MVLRGSQATDTLGNAEARVWVSVVAGMVLRRCDMINEAIQMHGVGGVSQWFPLTDMWHSRRPLRLVDGLMKFGHMLLGRAEFRSRGISSSGLATSYTLWANFPGLQPIPLHLKGPLLWMLRFLYRPLSVYFSYLPRRGGLYLIYEDDLCGYF